MLHAYGEQPVEPRLIRISSTFLKAADSRTMKVGGEESAETPPQGDVAVRLRGIYILSYR